MIDENINYLTEQINTTLEKVVELKLSYYSNNYTVNG
jgi:hypothetical protein